MIQSEQTPTWHFAHAFTLVQLHDYRVALKGAKGCPVPRTFENAQTDEALVVIQRPRKVRHLKTYPSDMR